MHILMTDVLVCPRCGPGFGLILLADTLVERRVTAGRLGCPNCRETYAVRGGLVDMVPPEVPPEDATEMATAATDLGAMKVAALLGVSAGGGYVLLLGDAAALASGVSVLVEEVEVIAVGAHATAVPRAAGEWGVSPVRASGVPVATGKMQGVALIGERVDALLEEAARAVRPTGRLLLDPAPADARARLAPLGLRVLAEEGTTLLAVRG